MMGAILDLLNYEWIAERIFDILNLSEKVLLHIESRDIFLLDLFPKYASSLWNKKFLPGRNVCSIGVPRLHSSALKLIHVGLTLSTEKISCMEDPD